MLFPIFCGPPPSTIIDLRPGCDLIIKLSLSFIHVRSIGQVLCQLLRTWCRIRLGPPWGAQLSEREGSSKSCKPVITMPCCSDYSGVRERNHLGTHMLAPQRVCLYFLQAPKRQHPKKGKKYQGIALSWEAKILTLCPCLATSLLTMDFPPLREKLLPIPPFPHEEPV